MKYLKMLGLAAVAAAALTAFVGAGTAMAENGVICSTNTNPCTSKWAVGTKLDWSLKSGTSAKLTTTGGTTLNTCSYSTVEQEITANPNATGTAEGPNKKVDWETATTKCAATPTTTLVLGGGKITGITGTVNGNLIATSKIEVTNNLPETFGGSCNYGVEAGTAIGTVTGGTAPEFHANAVAKKLNGGFLCPETTKWVATYVLTSPTGTPLYVRPS